VRRVRFYIEGNSKRYHGDLTEGFQNFLKPLRDSIRPQWDIRTKLCNSRWDAFEDFDTGSALYPDDICVLLVDSEWPVTKDSPWQHLGERESWDMRGLTDDRCYLMVQAMEAWFFADIETLAAYYGQHFNRNAMGKTADIESIPKDDLFKRLEQATADKKVSKGKYSKGNHSGFILRKLDPQKVQERSPHCERIFVEIPKAVAKRDTTS
jgi:hypothetical protein